MSGSNCCFLTCIQLSQVADKVAWYSHLFKNFPQFVVIHTVKGFGVVNKAEVDVFLELSCFFDDLLFFLWSNVFTSRQSQILQARASYSESWVISTPLDSPVVPVVIFNPFDTSCSKFQRSEAWSALSRSVFILSRSKNLPSILEGASGLPEPLRNLALQWQPKCHPGDSPLLTWWQRWEPWVPDIHYSKFMNCVSITCHTLGPESPSPSPKPLMAVSWPSVEQKA